MPNFKFIQETKLSQTDLTSAATVAWRKSTTIDMVKFLSHPDPAPRGTARHRIRRRVVSCRAVPDPMWKNLNTSVATIATCVILSEASSVIASSTLNTLLTPASCCISCVRHEAVNLWASRCTENATNEWGGYVFLLVFCNNYIACGSRDIPLIGYILFTSET